MAIIYDFRGEIDNLEILDYYNNNKVDCFITTSASEGLPVSIMEAMSSEIPVIATNVGGIKEMLDGNGILIPANPTINEITNAIESLLQSDNDQKKKMARKSRSIWSTKFDATKNARDFVLNLEKCFPHKDEIVVVTNGYPFGGEKSFIEEEIKELVKHYRIIIIALSEQEYSDKEKERYINELYDSCNVDSNKKKNILVYNCIIKWSFTSTVKACFKYFADNRLTVEKKAIRNEKNKRFAKMWESIKYYAYAEKFSEWLYKNKILGEDCSKKIIYTFWYRYSTLAFCLNKMENNGLSVVTRLHGYDLYNERIPKTERQPFRQLMNEGLDGLYFVCEEGLKYYKMTWDDVREDLLHISYIGSKSIDNHGEKKNNEKDDIFRIVSCSNLIPLKRVDMIIDALAMLNKQMPQINIEWIHFGDGVCRQQLEDLAQKQLGQTT